MLWREMCAEGFVGQSGVVSQWAQRQRLAEKANQSGFVRTPSAKILARLITSARDGLAKSEAILVAVIEENVPELVAARKAIGAFQSMIRSKSAAKLDDWLAIAKGSLIGSFANGVEKDRAAVSNAIISQWSNGQTEGQITRLKLIKRQMYGRAETRSASSPIGRRDRSSSISKSEAEPIPDGNQQPVSRRTGIRSTDGAGRGASAMALDLDANSSRGQRRISALKSKSSSTMLMVRGARQISQDAFAVDAGIDRTYVSRLETG